MSQIPIAGYAIPDEQCPYPIQECPYPIQVPSMQAPAIQAPSIQANGSNKVFPSTAHYVEIPPPVITEQPTAEALKPEPEEDSCFCNMIWIVVFIVFGPILCLGYFLKGLFS